MLDLAIPSVFAASNPAMEEEGIGDPDWIAVDNTTGMDPSGRV